MDNIPTVEERLKIEISMESNNEEGEASAGPVAGRRRQKVPLPPGHTLANWNLQVQTRKKNLGWSTPSLRVTPSMLATHNSTSDAWVALNGKVFDMTRYLDYHPGGVKKLMLVAGKDGTSLFYKTHAWVNFDNLLAADWVGVLVPEPDENEQ